MAKQVFVEATFPDLKGNCYAIGRGTGGVMPLALKRAVVNMFKANPHLKKKKITRMTLSVTINTITTEERQKQIDDYQKRTGQVA